MLGMLWFFGCLESGVQSALLANRMWSTSVSLSHTYQLNLLVPAPFATLALKTLNISTRQLDRPFDCDPSTYNACQQYLDTYIERKFPNINFTIVLGTDNLEHSIGIIGPFYSSDAIKVSKEVATPHQLPLVSYGSTATQLSDQSHPYFSRVVASNDLQANSMIDLCFRFGWISSIAILGSTDEYGTSGRDSLLSHANTYRLKVAINTLIDESTVVSTLNAVKAQKCKYIVAFLVDSAAKLLLKTAQDMGMLNGDFIFFFSENAADLITVDPRTNVASFVDVSEDNSLLRGILFIQSSSGYWKKDSFLRENWEDSAQVPQIAPYIYDAFMSYAFAVDAILSEIADPLAVHNGTRLMKNILSQDFLGATGRIVFNRETGDRISAPYLLLNIDSQNRVSQVTRWEVGRLFHVDKQTLTFPGGVEQQILVDESVREIIGAEHTFFPIPDSGSPPRPRYGASSSLHHQDSQIMVFGGRVHVETRFSDFWGYDMKEGLWKQIFSFKAPTARSEHVSFIWKGMSGEYFHSIFGGWNGIAIIGEQWNYRFSLNSWFQSKDDEVPVSARIRARTENLNRDTFLIGGEGILHDNNDVWKFNHLTEKWIQLDVTNPEQFAARRDHCLTAYKNSLFVWAGRSNDLPNGMDDILFLHLDTQEWQRIYPQNVPIVRYAPICELWREKMYMGLGYSYHDDSPGHPYGDFYRMDLQPADGIYRFESIDVSSTRGWEGRDHMDAVQFEGHLIFFGGWAKNGILNDFVRFNMEEETLQIVHGAQEVPPNVYNHKEIIVANQLYVYGGEHLKNGVQFSNDIFRLDLDKFIWSRLYPSGKTPNPTAGHAMVSFSDIIFVHGGVGLSGFSNTLWDYSIQENVWNEFLFAPFDPMPSARAYHTGEVLENYSAGKRSIYFIGGMVQQKILYDLWTYSIDERTWSEITVKNNGIKPTSLAHVQSAILNGKIIIYGGEDHAVAPMQHVFAFDTAASEWQIYAEIPAAYQTSRCTIAAAHDTLYIFAGSYYDELSDILLEVRNGTVRRIRIEDSSAIRPERRSDHSLQFYKSSLFIFGGIGAIPSKKLHSDITVYSNLFEYRLKSCSRFEGTNSKTSALSNEDSNSCVLCSPGTYHERDRCLTCPAGYYAENHGQTQCDPCPPGFYGPWIGSTSSKLCFPCKPGTFQSMSGSSECQPCDPEEHFCPIGSTQRIPLSMKSKQDGTYTARSIQPTDFEERAEQVQQGVQISSIVTAIVTFILLVIFFLGWFWLRRCIYMVDLLYADKHNYLIGVMKRKKTVTGGLFSILFCLFWVAVAFNVIYPYLVDNIRDVKTLAPVLGTATTTDVLVARLNFSGPPSLFCVDSPEQKLGEWGTCHRTLQVYAMDLDFEETSYICSKILDKTNNLPVCHIEITYRNLRIKSSMGIVGIVVNEEGAFSSHFGWNVSTTSGYPVVGQSSRSNQVFSSAQGEKYSSQANLYRGKQIPTQMRLKYIQSIFQMKAERTEGAHLENLIFEQGSSVDSSSFSSRNGFRFHFLLEVAENFLSVQRTERKSLMGLFAEIGGASSVLFTVMLLLLRGYESIQSIVMNSPFVKRNAFIQRLVKYKRVKDRLEIVDEVKKMAKQMDEDEYEAKDSAVGRLFASSSSHELAEGFLKLEDESQEGENNIV